MLFDIVNPIPCQSQKFEIRNIKNRKIKCIPSKQVNFIEKFGEWRAFCCFAGVAKCTLNFSDSFLLSAQLQSNAQIPLKLLPSLYVPVEKNGSKLVRGFPAVEGWKRGNLSPRVLAESEQGEAWSLVPLVGEVSESVPRFQLCTAGKPLQLLL